MKAMNYFFQNLTKCLFSLFLLFILSANLAQAETCNGLTVDAGAGGDRCYQASEPLLQLISCLAGKDANLVITSIGDNLTMFDTCVSSYSRQCSSPSESNCCAHDAASCHYGGVTPEGERACTDGSHAIDLRANSSNQQTIINQVTACGGRAFFENGNHVHASVGSCGCDGWPVDSSLLGIPYTPKPVCFQPEFPIPGLQLIDQKNTECPNGILLSEKGDTIPIYINALYQYAAGLAGVIAMFMIVFASWQWIMASGNAGKIDNAKDTIKGALLGLTLLFAGNLLLSNITKNLVDFASLNIPPITTRYLNTKPIQCTAEVIAHNCGETFTDSNGASCIGTKCAAGECKETSANQLCGTISSSCECRPSIENDPLCEDIENPTCVMYGLSNMYADAGRTACLNDNCRALDGPCRWDDDGTETCVSVEDNGSFCGDNTECFVDFAEDPHNSQYCCCNDATIGDFCVERQRCNDCHPE